MATKLTINIRKAKKEIIDSLVKNKELQHATVDGTLRIGIDMLNQKFGIAIKEIDIKPVRTYDLFRTSWRILLPKGLTFKDEKVTDAVIHADLING